MTRPALALLPAALLCACGEASPAQRPAAGPPVEHAPVEALALAGEDTVVRAAQAALRARRPWEATRLLAPLLADSARGTPAARLVGAAAASRWGGWRQAEALLADAAWADTLAGGEGRELLARAALARRTPEGDSLAAAHARRALAAAPAPGTERGVRLVLLARALDRVATRPGAPPALADSAARAYADAAALLAPAASWLRLRAAGVEADAGRRASLLAGATGAAAAARARWTEAQARERFGDAAGAARLYDSLGSRAQALALRLRAEPGERDAVRRALVALVAGARGTPDARAAAELLDRSFAPLAPAEQLAVARSAAAAGPLARAAAGYAAAFAGGAGDDADRFAYGSLLFRLGRSADAAAQFALVRGARAGEADYQRARALLRAGRGGDATALLRAIVATRAADSAAAGSALYLLGDLAVDDGREAEAREAFRGTAERYRGHPLAPTAAFRAALISLIAGRHGEAARELDSLAARYPRGAERLAALYWGGRAWSAAGDATLARARWTAVREAEPASYYARVAARRLDAEPWVPPDTVPTPAIPADVAAAIARAALLDELDMDVEARFERDRLAADARGAPARRLATARALADAGFASPAIRLAEQALAAGAPRSAALYRLLYPLVYEESVVAEARTRGVDPALVAGLIRQESSFTPGALSAAGARGLMQLLPSVAATVARGQRIAGWDPVLLYQPDVNVRLGAAHLAGVLRQYPEPGYALADYNAGRSRVLRWRTRAGADDPELFAERIPYVETRDYVRAVLRNRDLYRALYPSLAWDR